MRRVQHRSGPEQQTVEVVAVQRRRRDVDDLLLPVTPDRDRDALLLHGALDLAEAVDRCAVDREQQVAFPEHGFCRRTRDYSLDAEHLAS